MQLELTDNEAWYLRSLMHRALVLNGNEISNLQKFLKDPGETPRTLIASVEGAESYMRQWDREVRRYLAPLAEQLDFDLTQIEVPSILQKSSQ